MLRPTLALTLVLLFGLPDAAAAQPSAADRAAAAQAYDRASAAYLARQYGRAASLFETAYRVMPNATALLQAARAHQLAEHPARAATLAHRLRERFELPASADDEMAELLSTTTPTLVRVELEADGEESWEVDGALQDGEDRVVFLPPGEHTVTVTFATGAVELAASGDAGAVTPLRAEAPPAPPEPEVAEPALVAASAASGQPADDGGGVEPWLFVSLASATAVAAGFLIAFGVDAWSGLAEYEADPSREGLEDGQARELRTNIMFGVTGGLAVAALITALVTDWGGDDVQPTASISGQGLALGLRGTLP